MGRYRKLSFFMPLFELSEIDEAMSAIKEEVIKDLSESVSSLYYKTDITHDKKET